jgi:hypothetical protein
MAPKKYRQYLATLRDFSVALLSLQSVAAGCQDQRAITLLFYRRCGVSEGKIAF